MESCSSPLLTQHFPSPVTPRSLLAPLLGNRLTQQPHTSSPGHFQVTRQLEEERRLLLEKKRAEQEEAKRKQEELDRILQENRRKVGCCMVAADVGEGGGGL